MSGYLPEGELPVVLRLHIVVESSVSNRTERKNLCGKYLIKSGFWYKKKHSKPLFAVELVPVMTEGGYCSAGLCGSQPTSLSSPSQIPQFH